MFKDTLKVVSELKFVDKDAIIFDDGKAKCEKLSYGAFKENIDQVSKSLQNAGIRKGDRVILLSENNLRWLPMFLGIAGMGAIAVPVDGNLAIERFHAILEDCKPAAIIISRKFESRFAEFMIADCEVSTTFNLNFDLIRFENDKPPKASVSSDPCPEDIAAIVYTSGTTGSPKGIMLSHKAFISSVSLGTEISGYTAEDKMLALLPFTHVFALVDSGLVQFYNWSTLVICNSFNPAEIVSVMMRHKITYLLVVPRLAELMAFGLMQNPDLKLPGLTIIIGGAAPRPEIMKLMISRNITVFQGFGMTETAAGVLIGKDAPIESVGRAIEPVKIKISDSKQSVGELLISTPTIFSGVFGRPELDAEMFEGGYFKTGDLAYIDEDGYVYIKGRAKEVIISASGVNVYPDELEMRLGTLPYAEEYVIFGLCENNIETPALALLCRNEFFKDNNIGKIHEYIEEDIRQKTKKWPDAEKIKKIFLSEKPLPRSASAKIKRCAVAKIFDPQVARPENKRKAANYSDSRLFDFFRSEIAAFLNTGQENIQRNTRLDSFLQLDSLGVVALLVNLEKKFEVSLGDLVGASVETFEELYDFIAEKVNIDELLDKYLDKSDSTDLLLPPMLDISLEAVKQRQQFVSSQPDCNDFYLPIPENPEDYSGNIEGLIGFSSIPTGICGPLLVRGQHATGEFYVPLATTEGALVASVTRGCQVINMSGGAEVRIVSDSIVRTPIFVFNSLEEMFNFSKWVEETFNEIKNQAQKTTSHGKLLEIQQYPIGAKMVLRFVYSTGDASGQNMTTIATRSAVDYILTQFPGKIDDWFLESNLSGDKKINSINFATNRGKKVIATCKIPAKVIKGHLHTSAERMCRLAELSLIASVQAHAFGAQAHYANTLAAVYIAAGQDPACVAESAAGITHLEMIGSELQISVTLPGLMVGTVGGGTRLATQQQCLRMMGCAGAEKAAKFAEILGASVLAGEISIIGAMAADEFTQAHARYGRAGGIDKKDTK